MTFFSYISDVAIRIGDDVMEVGNQGKHYINGVLQTVGATQDLARFKVSSSRAAKKPRHVYKIHLGGKMEIVMREYKDWITVSVLHPSHADFKDSVGLMGSFDEGVWLGRDGISVHKNIDEYGQDWQVREVDGFLFQTPSAYPERCNLPATTDKKIRLRRLEESSVTREEAWSACEAHRMPEEIEDCVNDVQISGDLDMAVDEY